MKVHEAIAEGLKRMRLEKSATKGSFKKAPSVSLKNKQRVLMDFWRIIPNMDVLGASSPGDRMPFATVEEGSNYFNNPPCIWDEKKVNQAYEECKRNLVEMKRTPGFNAFQLKAIAFLEKRIKSFES